ncbi:hypothetical protein D9756_002863 [Leucocoprinus leucothites]|uniref:Auxin efflux carrier n=1 Tax=Leucocoprinus leucothites TaxID=201217 RepID=A0A8H5G6E7_9AGAR|nr:hypothetical protein D9756_002863 [Leucoagaricus leucothites]
MRRVTSIPGPERYMTHPAHQDPLHAAHPATMSSAFAIAIAGAFQSSLSVILTVVYGVIAARLGMVSPMTIKDVSTLCANLFLPALLFASIGRNLTIEKLQTYVPIFVWSAFCVFLSMGTGKIVTRLWRLPSWTVAVATFNNTASLPILLTQSFANAGLLSTIAGSNPSGAIERATSYYLVYSVVAKVATFSIGPYLFDKDCLSGPQPPLVAPHSPAASETSPLLPTRRPSMRSPYPIIRSALLSFSPITWSVILAIIIGLCPPLHHLFFSLPQDGGYLSAWVSESISNMGGVFAVLQIFIVGAKLSRSFEADSLSEPSSPPAKALVAIFAIRFVLWSFLSVLIIYWLVLHTALLPQDPVMWWCMIIMPIGPPAMTLSTLVDIINVGEGGRNMVARTLAFMYGVTPVMSLSVVVALRACEIAMEKKGGTTDP